MSKQLFADDMPLMIMSAEHLDTKLINRIRKGLRQKEVEGYRGKREDYGGVKGKDYAS